MSKIVLGLSAYYHDSAAAISVDGMLMAACAEERFTRVKHDRGFPQRSAKYCLQSVGIEAHELDSVVFYERPHYKFIRTLKTLLANYPLEPKKFASSMMSWLSEKLWVRMKICDLFDLEPTMVSFIEHHESHAAYAFYASPFDTAAVLTLDGVGESACGTLGLADRVAGVSVLDSTHYPDSLGLLYSAITAFIGFKSNSDECSTMALSAFGQDEYAELFRNMLQFEDSSLKLDERYFNFSESTPKVFKRPLLDSLGQPISSPVEGFSSFLDPAEQRPDPASVKISNIAASLQARSEHIILEHARLLHAKTSEKNLCYAGGVALNAVANGRLLQESSFENIFIPPDPGDGGGAAGAALAGAHRLGITTKKHEPTQIYSGPTTDMGSLRKFIDLLEPHKWHDYASVTLQPLPRDSVSVQDFTEESDFFDFVVSQLKDGMIVAWVNGRSEFGPRALGNRSILCDPSRIDVAERLSKIVKIRAAYRPYALSVAREAARQLFPTYTDHMLNSSPLKWMQATLLVAESIRPLVRAALHSNGTTRPQIVDRDSNPDYHRLLCSFGEQSGLPVLLNTSFNDSGEPLITTVEEAMLVFSRTDIDMLCINRTVISKKR